MYRMMLWVMVRTCSHKTRQKQQIFDASTFDLQLFLTKRMMHVSFYLTLMRHTHKSDQNDRTTLLFMNSLDTSQLFQTCLHVIRIDTQQVREEIRVFTLHFSRVTLAKLDINIRPLLLHRIFCRCITNILIMFVCYFCKHGHKYKTTFKSSHLQWVHHQYFNYISTIDVPSHENTGDRHALS